MKAKVIEASSDKLMCVKIIKETTSLSLKESKDAVEGTSFECTEKTVQLLKQEGCIVKQLD